MKYKYIIPYLIFASFIFNTEIEISRDYKINENISKIFSLSDSLKLDGTLYFQACDDNACIPISQDLSHIAFINRNSESDSQLVIAFSGNIEKIDNHNPMTPDWGSLKVNTFLPVDGADTFNYSIIFDINNGYHIFTTDTLLSPLGTGNTDLFWEDNDFIIKELSYSEPVPYVKYNELYNQDIGYHDGKVHQKVVTENKDSSTASSSISTVAFFIASFLAGLAAIFTPCVFPMIPLTVSFFTSKGDSSSKSAPLFYGFSIIFIFIMLGLGFSFVLGASALNALATSAVANLIFFVIFFIFALSFFGAFEITLPNSFLNKINKKADQGGYIGIFFMAFTLVLISFSCTAPIVGSVLILASDGEFIKPIIGMLGFSLSFALVFTLTALFPRTLDNLPKGINLNSIKVFLGFLELAFSLKFLSKADLTNQWGLLNRDIYLAIWIVIFSFLGLYLLGKIKLYHDDDSNKIGIVRLMLAISSFSFVVAIFPGLFGAPLSWLSGYLPPPSTQEFDLIDRFDQIESNDSNYYTDFPSEVKHQDLKNFKLPLGLKGFFDYEEALEYSKIVNKPLFLDFTGFACENCRLMEHNVWSKPHILKLLKKDFIIVSLFVDSKYKLKKKDWSYDKNNSPITQLGLKNLNIQTEKFKNAAQPLYVIIDSNENIISDPIGYCDEQVFYNFLKKGIK